MPESSSPPARDPLGIHDDALYEPPESLAGAVFTSLKWKFASQVVREGTRLVMAVVLARILTPGEWGLAIMALVFAALLEIVPDSITGGLVQRARITERDRSTIFWTAVGLGVSVAVLGIALSGTIARFFGEPEVAGLFIAVSVGFVITSLAVVPEALLIRDLAYRSLELRQMVATVVGAIVALTLAFAGAGSWAIIGNALAIVTTSAVLLWWFVPWRPKLVFSATSFTSLGAYGMRMFGTQVLTYFQLNGEKLLVGRYLGAASLGTYSFAFNLMFTPIVNIAFPIQHVLFPAYATIQEDDDRLRTAWLRGKRLTVAALAPAFLTVFVVAPDLVRVVFGSRWDDAVPVLQLLCVAGVAYALATQNTTLLLVRDQMKTLLRWGTFVTATTLLAVVAGLPFGIVGVAAAYAAAQWLLVVPDMWITARSASISLLVALRASCAALPFAVAATVAAYGLRLVLVEEGVPAAGRLAIVAASLVALYVGLIWFGSPTLKEEARGALKHVRNRDTA